MLTPHQAFLSEFRDERKSLLEAMLEAIEEECTEMTESIKWSAPTFSYFGKDRMTIMLHKKDRVGLILHTGSKPKEDKKAPHLFEDNTGLLEWNSNIRATIAFTDIDDFMEKKELFIKAVNQWIVKTKDL
ncbi:MAG TPA: DUF1801 domain-containing protein [Anaerolineaceae bacterium]|nr:DUF1801 domain-containing protein [Anaerolineaceae bacterium]